MANNIKQQLSRIGEVWFEPSQLRIIQVNQNLPPKEHHGISPEKAVTHYSDLIAVLDGPMFHHLGSGVCCPDSPWCTCFRLLDKHNGVDWPTKKPDSGLTISVSSKGDVSAAHGSHVAENSVVAVQLYPSLVVDGEVVGGSDGRVGRAGLGWMNNGKFLLMVGYGTLRDIANEFLKKGALWAGYTDGGSSTALYTSNGEFLGVHAKKPRVPCWLAVKNKE